MTSPEDLHVKKPDLSCDVSLLFPGMATDFAHCPPFNGCSYADRQQSPGRTGLWTLTGSLGSKNRHTKSAKSRTAFVYMPDLRALRSDQIWASCLPYLGIYVMTGVFIKPGILTVETWS